MSGDGFYRLRSVDETGAIVTDGQHRQHVQRAVGSGTAEDVVQEGVTGIRRDNRHLLVGDTEADVGDHPEEATEAALDGDVAADDHVLDRRRTVEANLNTAIDRAGDNDAEKGRILARHDSVLPSLAVYRFHR